MSLATLALLLLAAPAPAGALAVDPAGSVVKFHLHHKFHSVDGRSSSIEGKAVIGPDGTVMAMVRIPVSSFVTGDGNRDSNMRETMEVGKFPHVVFKCTASLQVPVARENPTEAKLQGELELHGVKRAIEVPAQVSFGADGGAVVKAKFPVSLEAHRIERPSLMFVKVDDQLLMDVELKLVNAPR